MGLYIYIMLKSIIKYIWGKLCNKENLPKYTPFEMYFQNIRKISQLYHSLN